MPSSSGPRIERSKYAPRIETVQIPTDKIRDLIGKGGATIRGIVEQTGAKIDVDDTGRVKRSLKRRRWPEEGSGNDHRHHSCSGNWQGLSW